jgi:exosome complex component MTR3
MILEQALLPALRSELYPRSTIDIFVQVLDCDGLHSALGAAITCASMALVNAGIEMRDIVIGCSAVRFTS